MKEKSTIIKDFVSTLGFPIVVTGWLLYERWTQNAQHEATLQQLTDSINKNSQLIQELIRAMGG